MNMKMNRFDLDADELPDHWYNILPDLPEPLPPPKEPEDGRSRLEFLKSVTIRECWNQEFSEERWIRIPEELRELYIQAGRPRPLYRALRLEKRLGLEKVRIYYKREDLSPTGSHKVNTALAQAYYAAKEGVEILVTETGAGQWGTALSYAARLNDLDPVVFWVRSVYRWKRDRRTFMKLYGAKVFASPSKVTEAGRRGLREGDKDGSLGLAISEGLEYASEHENAAYSLGSVLNHVLMHQTIIGLETIKQFELAEDFPDLVIACLGGGSNFGGIALPFVRERLVNKKDIRFLAAQSLAAPNLIKGEYRYDFGDTAEYTPLMKMYTLGHKVKMVPIMADGLRYHAAAPIISLLRKHGIVDAIAYPADEKAVFEAARIFVESEGWLPAPESSYAIRAAIDKALEYEKMGRERVILMNISGHGFLDLYAYRKKLFGK
jgi:tryptophan synthase beta chain